MKKRLLFLATLITLAMALGVICTNIPIKANASSNSNELISYKITLPSNYYSGKKTSKVTLHYGVNGWNDIKDTTMYVTTGDYHYGIPNKYEYNAIVKVRKGDTINYCFKVDSIGGTTAWNNNKGQNYSVVADESNVKTINYEINWLAGSNGINADLNSDVTLHYSLNNWDKPIDQKMEIKHNYENDNERTTWYKAILTVEEGTIINYCVKVNNNDGEKWDNNNQKNYSVIAK